MTQIRLPKAILILLLSSTIASAAEFKVANLFQDNMVLQRDKPVKVWGWAEAGTKVTVQFAPLPGSGQAAQKKTATASKDGRWMVTLDPMNASAESRELHIRWQGSGDRKQGRDAVPDG